MASLFDQLIREHAERLDRLAGPIDFSDVTSAARHTTTVALVDIEPTLSQREGRRRWPVITGVAAAVIAVVGGLVIATRIGESTGKIPADQPHSSTTTSETGDDGPRVLARGDDVHISGREVSGLTGLDGETVNIDALEHDGAVTGEFRVGHVTVTIQCAGTRSIVGDLILGGVVTDNPDGIDKLDGASVAVGDLIALIIRADSSPIGRRVTLYNASLWYGPQGMDDVRSCNDLVESVPPALDGGFFDDVGGDIEMG